jgi:hypothetical protein
MEASLAFVTLTLPSAIVMAVVPMIVVSIQTASAA